MTTRSRLWAKWAAAGGACGVLVVLGGCRSTEESVAPPVHPFAGTAPLPAENQPASAQESAAGVTQARHQEPDPGAALGGPAAAAPQDETIDLGVALRLAGVGNPTINLARERIREALADELGARSMLLPNVTIGGNYHKHIGPLQASFGVIRQVDSQSLYLGFGARTLAAESVAFPGVRLFAHLGDAVYEPLAARQRVSARVSDAQAVQNDILLRVATAYLELVGAEARRDVLRRGEADLAEIVRLTRVYAEKGQGRQSDADRAEAHADLLRQEVRRADEDIAVASARLCRLLNLDPSGRLRTPGGPVESVRLVAEDSAPEALVAAAVRARPELLARSAEVQEAQVRVKQEKVRPLVPTVSVGYSGGLFGGGSDLVDSQFGPLKGRSDFDAFAVWTFQNLGLGNRSLVRRANAVVGETVAGYEAAVNLVRREVIESQAAARSAARRIETAKASLGVAEDGYKLEMERSLKGGPGVGRPIELLDSFRLLLDARQDFLRAVVAFDVAQFRLFVAIGSNPLATPVAANAPAANPIPVVLPLPVNGPPGGE